MIVCMCMNDKYCSTDRLYNTRLRLRMYIMCGCLSGKNDLHVYILTFVWMRTLYIDCGGE